MVRIAQYEDAKAIAKVHVASWQAAYKGLMPDDFLASLSVERREIQWQEFLRQAEHVILVCEENSEIVGFASAGKARDEDLHDQVAELYTIYLLSDVWNKGYGKRMFQEIAKVLPRHGFTEIVLWVLESNRRAREFYQAMGLRPDGQSKTETWQNGVVLHEVRYQGKLNVVDSFIS
jgi:ribosomal protein S18 acetylase RimI-like enzyme